MKKICFHSFLPALPDQLTACNTLHLTTGLSIKLMHGKQVTRYTPEEFSAFGKKRGKMSGKGQGRRRVAEKTGASACEDFRAVCSSQSCRQIRFPLKPLDYSDHCVFGTGSSSSST